MQPRKQLTRTIIIVAIAVIIITLLAFGFIFLLRNGGIDVDEPTPTLLASTGVVPPPTQILETTDIALDDVTEVPDSVRTEIVQSTQAAIQETVTAVPIQAAGVESDDIIGDANVYPFYEDTIEYPDTTSVELSLIFTALNITATPLSDVTRIAITPLVPLPDVIDADIATITPRPARAEFAVDNIPPRVIASLVCLERSFEGCTTKTARQVDIGIDNRWEWILAPHEGIRGRQNMRLELYAADDNGEQVGNPMWQHSFSIDVRAEAIAASEENSLTFLVLILGIIGVLLISGFSIYRRRPDLPLNKRKPKPRVFISYRRAVGRADARAIHDNLTMNGVDAFLDVDDIHAGEFNEYIQQSIRESDYFIVVLAPGTLESKWVRKEIEYALEHDKVVIPILVNGFDLYGSEVTDDMKALQQQNALTLNAENFKWIISRLLEWMGVEDEQ